MRAASRLALALACTIAAAALAAGCGSSGSSGSTSGSGGSAESRPAPPKSDFPAAEGQDAAPGAERRRRPLRTGRLAGRRWSSTRGRTATPSASSNATAPRSPTPRSPSTSPRSRPQARAKSKSGSKSQAAKAEQQALDEPAIGPFPASIETLATKPAFRAQTTSEDPDAASVVYSTQIDFPSDGEWRIAALVREGGEIKGTLLPSAVVGEFGKIPRPGQPAPKIHTPTPADVGGDLAKITTRIPPDTQNRVDYADALGKEPILLLFATPQFCQSRVCGPVVDVAEQAKQEYEDKAAFIHMEIYNDNDPSKSTRPQVRAFHLPSEPWLFAIDRQGRISSVDRGRLRARSDDRRGEEGGGGMSKGKEKAAKEKEPAQEEVASKEELRASFAEEARRRCDVIAAGLATETTDFETMRAEAHALRGTAGVVGLRRLAELAGLMESDLAEAKTTGVIRGGRAHQIADAAKALAEGAAAAAKGEEEPPDVGRSLAQLFSA